MKKQTTLPFASSATPKNASGIQVVNARAAELRKMGYKDLQDFLDASPLHMYVGRQMRVKGATQSKWCNNHRLSEHNNNVDVVIEKFKHDVRTGPLHAQLPELQGKTLACWCYPAPCHATALGELLDEWLSE